MILFLHRGAGYTFRRLLAWLAILWRAFVMALLADASDTALAEPADAKPSVKPRRRRQRALLHRRLYSRAPGGGRGFNQRASSVQANANKRHPNASKR
jgi:hypothetical protein